MDEMMKLDFSAMRSYILEKFSAEGDFSFLKEEELPAMVDTLIGLDKAYMETSGVNEGGVYDDDEAYEQLFVGLAQKFPQYKMYCMRMTEDYLDFSEEYMAKVGAIEWE